MSLYQDLDWVQARLGLCQARLGFFFSGQKKKTMLQLLGILSVLKKKEKLKVDLTLPFCKSEFQSCVFYKINSISLVIQ